MQKRIGVYDEGMQKQRVTVTVNEELLQEASTAVSEGRSRSVSEWIGEAMAQRRDRDQRLAVLRRLVSEYEAEHGVSPTTRSRSRRSGTGTRPPR